MNFKLTGNLLKLKIDPNLGQVPIFNLPLLQTDVPVVISVKRASVKDVKMTYFLE